MADESEGQSIRNAYRRQGRGNGGDGSTGNGASEGQSIRDAYRTADTGTTQQTTAPPADVDPDSGAPTAPSGSDVPPWMMKEPGRVVGAAIEGYKAVPPIPRVPGDLVTAPLYNPLIAGTETALRLGAGAFRGGQQALAETFEPIGRSFQTPEITIPLPGGRQLSSTIGGPGLGRDVAALPEAFPTGNLLEPGVMPRAAVQPPVAPEVNALSPKFVSERMAPPREAGATDADRILQLIRHDEAEKAGVGPGMQPEAAEGVGPSPGVGGAPGSVGAAASREGTPASAIALTPEQAAAYGSMADKQWVFSSQEPGVRDTTEYIPGETISNAQREQTVNAARDQKTQRNISQQAAQDEETFLHNQSEHRKGYFQETAGNDVLQHTAVENADKAIDVALKDAFAHGGAVDPRGPAAAIAAERAGSAGKLPPLRSAMDQVEAALQKEDGSPETNPFEIYKARRLVNLLQSKDWLADNKAYGARDVQAALTRVKGAIDEAIEPAAPGFRKALSDYSTAQRAIEANEYMQEAEPKLYDGKSRMQFSRFHNFMVKTIMQRDPNVAPNPAQSLSDVQFARLQAIHDSLKRAASAEDLAKAKGSDSAQNLMDMAKEALVGMPGTLLSVGAGHLATGGLAGAIAGPMIKQGIANFFGRRGEARANQKMQNLLNPTGPTTPNPNPNLLNPGP